MHQCRICESRGSLPGRTWLVWAVAGLNFRPAHVSTHRGTAPIFTLARRTGRGTKYMPTTARYGPGHYRSRYTSCGSGASIAVIARRMATLTLNTIPLTRRPRAVNAGGWSWYRSWRKIPYNTYWPLLICRPRWASSALHPRCSDVVNLSPSWLDFILYIWPLCIPLK